MSTPESIAALRALVLSSEFAAVKAAADALDPALMLDDRFRAHLNAFRVGMTALAGLPDLQPDEEAAEE